MSVLPSIHAEPNTNQPLPTHEQQILTPSLKCLSNNMDLQTTLGSEPNLGEAERVPVKASRTLHR